ncbi:serine protease inhibitor ecotin [Gilliamella sp. B2776]|uniref:serine protease inhibitor ecotin n=1 Tax=unclassified Gilliamella TaxID=2685620 RepID=UPI0022698A21|nr:MULTISPECIES: serine protease inhibitor ecotin [unclassified Gilliamella]MCX8650012.1 serine protease inhibitor ecotin [Gilliamella sp. B2779]MCX8654945.1 serine protease inhibitor ecotin [Gilliamella sp. B2737]MCX8656588.1 serine protease inhibitor ecotin [Gilliamella sp. B2894]MCX8665380.1 serine protease inhibitor ecotin [Gilliamella sp. B2887]MCX8691785.1 serine protease inhibitor ecotin [Gilliamella sp. B2776]
MKKLLLLMLMSIVLPACSTTPKLNNPVQNANDTAPYPVAMAGYTRYAIHLPSLANENKARVEVLIGKEMNTDCNAHRLGGMIKQEELKGWGYNYYVVDKVNDGISTLMACPEGTNKNQFVTMNHNLGLLDYNSRLPIVFYVPSDLTVKYRVWQPGSKLLQASAE